MIPDELQSSCYFSPVPVPIKASLQFSVTSCLARTGLCIFCLLLKSFVLNSDMSSSESSELIFSIQSRPRKVSFFWHFLWAALSLTRRYIACDLFWSCNDIVESLLFQLGTEVGYSTWTCTFFSLPSFGFNFQILTAQVKSMRKDQTCDSLMTRASLLPQLRLRWVLLLPSIRMRPQRPCLRHRAFVARPGN